MANPNLCLLGLLLALFCLQPSLAQTDLWNRIVRLQSNLQTQDYPANSGEHPKSDVYRGLFSLQIYSNQTFAFVIYYEKPLEPQIIRGEAVEAQTQWLKGRTYQLSSSKLVGSASYEISAGLKWTFSLEVKSKGLAIAREEVSYDYVNWLGLIIFGLGGFFLFPLVDRARHKLVYNIWKRTHPFFQVIILYKFGFIWACFLYNCYHYIVNLPWYYIFPIYGVYIITMAPSLIHAMYFLSAIQKKVKQMQCFTSLGVNTKCLLMSGIFLSIPLACIVSLFFHKGVYLYFGLSLATLYQFVHSCNQRKYTFSRVLFYDLMLTAVLSLVSMFLPSLNFDILTWKETVVFWNYNLGILIFGVLLSGKIINLEIVEEVHLQEESTFDPREESESERRQDKQKMPTIQMIQT